MMKNRRHPLFLIPAFLLSLVFVIQCAAPGRALVDPQLQPTSDYGLTLSDTASSSNPIVRIAAIGDARTADSRQAAVGSLLYEVNRNTPLDGIILLGDNIYVRGKPEIAFEKSFLMPYARLIEKEVPFFATLGNHDLRRGMMEYQINHPLLNMHGRRYYSKVFGEGTIEVFFLDTNTIQEDAEQIAWLDQSLEQSGADWKIVAMHHPMYTTARRHPPDYALRDLLEPIFLKHGVNIVLAGHNHIYERLRPVNGIRYVTAGSGGALNRGNLSSKSSRRAAGNDQKNVALVLSFNSRACHLVAYTSDGKIVDEAYLPLHKAPEKESVEMSHQRF